MSRLWFPPVAFGALALLGLLAPPAAGAESWGTVKGQVVLDAPVPKPEKLNVMKDQAHCLRNGPLYSESYVVNPKNKGVRWAVVWLLDASSPTKELPVHPSLKAVKPAKVVIDQPCCMFEPHVVALREGQELEVKNSANISHNVNVLGGALGPNINPILPPNKSVEMKDIKARPSVINISCSIHPWMKGYVWVFKSPYFAVTDADGKFEIKNAPARKYRLVIWQESTGWVLDGKSPYRAGGGKVIDIKAGGVTDLGQVKAAYSKD
jgi:hypothetical protein